MKLNDLAEFFAVLTILEPSTKICEFTARLATAGSTTKGETDVSVIKELKKHLAEMEEELKGIQESKLAAKEKLLENILTPDE